MVAVDAGPMLRLSCRPAEAPYLICSIKLVKKKNLPCGRKFSCLPFRRLGTLHTLL